MRYDLIGPKTLVVPLAVLIVLATAACAYRPKIITLPLPPEEQPVEQISVPSVKKTIKIGEKLTYAVDWRGIPSGKIILEVKEIVTIGQRQYYHIIAQALPNSFFSFFYKVNYLVETYVDTETYQPIKFHKKRILRNVVSEETINFDYARNEALWQYTGSENKIIRLTANSQDLLSFLYFFRLQEIKLGKEYPLDIIYNASVWEAKVKVDTFELVKFNGTGIKTFTIKLISRLAKHITGGEKMKIYFSFSDGHLPLLFHLYTKIGPLTGVLREPPHN
ncbi:MAG: DUF3108 domain-containing protein [Candidatus Omnitrophota bacterium]